MRQYNSDNKELFSKYAEQLIKDTSAEVGKLDFSVVKCGVDFLMENGKYIEAERCLFYNISNPNNSNRNKFALICRGLFLCSFAKELRDRIYVYEDLLNDLKQRDSGIVVQGMETPLYLIHRYILYTEEISQLKEFEVSEVERMLRLNLKSKFNCMADILPSIPYYKAFFYKFHNLYPKLVLDILRDAAKVEKNDEELYVYAAQTLIRIGTKESLDKAEKLLNNVLDRNAYNDKAWFEIGELYHELRNYEEEMNAYKKAEIINKKDSRYPYQIAETYYDNGNYANALEYFLKYDGFPKENRMYEVYDRIGNCYMNIGQFDEAIEYYDKSLNSNGIMNSFGISQEFVMKLICLIKLGRAKEAETEYNRVDSENKIDLGIWPSLKAQILLALGKQDEAESYLMEMANNNEFDAFTLTELIEFQLKHKTYILARFYINMLLCFTQELHNALMYEAVVDYKTGDKNAAANNLNTAFKIDPLAKENFNSYCPEAKTDIVFQNMITELPF